ncbi:ABC transporter substrate-binding protein [Bifidobacterium indicum]|uniref:ABC transporter substrate-binding protein n=1 Tax=Bifidobacterium indicum TaxID=1691 RepID=UPI0030DC6474
MKLHQAYKPLATAAVLAVLLSGCGGGSGSGESQSSSNETLDKNVKASISMAGWSLDMTPEFKTLVDGFEKEHPNIKINIKQYSADDYDKQLTADISSGSQPDVFPIKSLQKYYVYSQSKGMADLSDIAKGYEGDKNIDVSQYKMDDGKYYALPYRADAWVLFYNKDMFKKAGVSEPDGTWTWDDYTKAAEQLKQKLPEAGYDANSVYPIYQHTWQSVVQAFAQAQSGKEPKDNFFKGDYSYLKSYYKRALKWQDEKLTIDWNTASTNKVQYQPQFGTEKAAMMPMGTWYAAVLVEQQKNGQANKFEWGLAPVPQNPEVRNKSSKPITFGDPTGLAISSKTKGDQLKAAKEFVKWCAGEGGSKALANISTTPAYFSKSVTDVFFKVDGMAKDQLSEKTWRVHDTRPENPVGAATDTIQNVLKDTHSSIMTETKKVGPALDEAASNIKDQGVLDE